MINEEISPQTLKQMQSLASRMRADEGYMAWLAAAYQKQERLTEMQLMDMWKLNPAQFVRLLLCRKLDSNAPDFASQVQQVADYAGMDAGQLAAAIRQVESLQALRDRPAAEMESGPVAWQTGLLSAARDRNEGVAQEKTEYDTGETNGGDDVAGQ